MELAKDFPSKQKDVLQARNGHSVLAARAPTERTAPLVPLPLELQVRACTTERARRTETKKNLDRQGQNIPLPE